MTRPRPIIFIIGAMFVTLVMARASQAVDSSEIALEKLAAPDALVLLRAIAGVRTLEVADNRTIRVLAPPEAVSVVRQVLDLAEHPTDASAEVPTIVLADGSLVASIHLRWAPLSEVSRVLRSQIGIARYATTEALSSVVIRDSKEQVEAAVTALKSLEAAHHGQQ